MADAASRLEEIQREAEQAAATATTRAELEDLRVRYLGRKSELTTTLRSIGELPPEERGRVGQAGNAVRQALEGTTIALAPGEGPPLAEVRADPPVVLCLGAEREGLSEAVLARAKLRAHLPLAEGGAGSLNVAMAATAALYERTARNRMARDA